MLAFDGDSISVWPPLVTGFVELTRPAVSPLSDTPNLGSGFATVSVLASRAATLDAHINQTRKFNILVVEAGTNDIYFGGTAATVFADLKAYCTARRAAGWKVVVATILPRLDGTPANFNTIRKTVNDSIRADSSFYDALADIGDTATTMGADTAPNDTSLYETDKVHPTNPVGHSFLGPVFRAAVHSIIP